MMKRTIVDVGTEIESVAATVATLAESLNSDENIPTKECIQKALHALQLHLERIGNDLTDSSSHH